MSELPTKRAEIRSGREPGRGFEIMRTELVWPGKYDEKGNRVAPPRVPLPFRVDEVIEQGRVSLEGRELALPPSFGETPGGPAENGWRNKLIRGDALLVAASLLEDFAEKIDLIYIDPPFATGADFFFSTEIGEGEPDSGAGVPRTLEQKAYRDTWAGGTSGYLGWFFERLLLARDLLSPEGSILIHCDPRLSHVIGLLADEVFGAGDRGAAQGRSGFRNEIVWMYGLGGSSPTCYPKKHDVILWYSKGSTWYFDPPRIPATSRRMKGLDKKCPDYWNIPAINNMAVERTGYPTQKPEALLERIVRAHSRRDDRVLDLFCGSGTTLVVAEKLVRRWIGCDIGRFAIHTTRKRLLDLHVKDPTTGEERGCRPFEVFDLGRHARKYWQGIAFGDGRRSDEATACAAHVEFILGRYQARPVAGTRIHGQKDGAFVHVGAVDSVVTFAQIEDAAAEARRLGGTELHVLGWEFEMGLHDPDTQSNHARHGVTVRRVSIPVEILDRRAVKAGDVLFFDLPGLIVEVKPEKGGKRGIRVALKDFVLPFTNLVPDEVREKIHKWSDYIDYWAVDWDFRDDTFVNRWRSYRTRRNRALALETPVHTYDRPGTYQILVDVVDIFGNDTRRLVEWEAR